MDTTQHYDSDRADDPAMCAAPPLQQPHGAATLTRYLGEGAFGSHVSVLPKGVIRASGLARLLSQGSGSAAVILIRELVAEPLEPSKRITSGAFLCLDRANPLEGLVLEGFYAIRMAVLLLVERCGRSSGMSGREYTGHG